MNITQRRILVATVAVFLSISLGMWGWYFNELSKIEADGQERYDAAVQMAMECSKQSLSENLSVECQKHR